MEDCQNRFTRSFLCRLSYLSESPVSKPLRGKAVNGDCDEFPLLICYGAPCLGGGVYHREFKVVIFRKNTYVIVIILFREDPRLRASPTHGGAG